MRLDRRKTTAAIMMVMAEDETRIELAEESSHPVNGLVVVDNLLFAPVDRVVKAVVLFVAGGDKVVI